ncbi:MAG: PH domain-containing protein [Patescibacteria group bacterium]
MKLFIFYIILAILPLVAYYFFQLQVQGLLSGAITGPLLTMAFSVYYLALLVFSLTLWTENYLDIWTLTTHRIINRKQNGLFNRMVAELDLHRVQDVTVEEKGFFSTVLNYGDIYIQSAGEVERFVFHNVPNPYQMAKTIQSLDEKIKNQHPVI